jgi:23S rRNA pseudouridine1911/1915/1917 synthase
VSTPRTLTADRGDIGKRLDLVLRRHLTDVDEATRTRVQSWIENGQVALNGDIVRRSSTRAALGDVVTIALPELAPRPVMAAEDVDLSILYEDDQLMVIDKPAGIVVHPGYKRETGTLMNALLWHKRSWTATADETRPSIVGRLDMHTSGLVVVAKSGRVHAALQRTMMSPDTEKDYLALVYGRVKIARGEIDLRLARDASDRRRIVASKTVGMPSLTRFVRLARVSAPKVGLSLLRCRLVTGRTHQIRVHLAARGWPLVGDRTYGTPQWARIVDPALAAAAREFPRQALHAWRIAVTHPGTRQRLVVEAPVPKDLAVILRIAELGLRISD